MHRFVIVGTQRTGSSALGEALSLHPEVACGWEWTQRGNLLLSKVTIAKRALSGDFLWLDEKQRKHMEDLLGKSLRHIGYRRLFRSSNKWFLHPKMAPVLAIDRFGAHLKWFEEDEGLKIIHIVRDDNIAWISSKVVARKTGRYFGQEYPGDIKIRVNVREALKRIQAKLWIDTQIERLRNTGRYIQVCYEEFSKDQRKVVEDVIAFLGCDAGMLPPLKLKAKKQLKKPLPEVIENYDDLVEAIRSRRLEHGLKL